MKVCTKCKTEYPATLEYFDKNGKYLTANCKVCISIKNKERYQKNIKNIKKMQKAWRQLNSEKLKTTKKKQSLKKLGFTPELFDAMLEAQGNVCALCGTDKSGGSGTFHADHDHNNGKPRGLLCMSCNISLGHIEAKNSDWLNKAQKYIEQGGFFTGNSQENVTKPLQ